MHPVLWDDLHITFLVACFVAIWIICNELISILENMIDIGVSIPKFLMPIVKNIKRYTENAVNIDENEEDDNNGNI